ncbi:hypothetical protein B0T22DRAFT_379133 [Podospora appendiculata]|uniref:Gamma-butyrobetaine dioxygenase n=1 Tax=Podospora appendiculata TaxID=314037 RepID=A0AAE1CD77_9PEZI|nr:hypothetical protein B0T22DRAFT_379133 [Podospora appendiculata]
MRIPLLWLRDACRCPRCVDPHSGQKYFSTIDLPNKPKVRSASFTSVWGLRVVWESDNLVKSGATEADEHTGVWSKNSLISWQADHGLRTPHALSPERTLWTRDSYTALLSAGATRFSYADWNDDRGQAEFRKSLEALRDTGLIFLTGVKEHSAKKSLVYSVARKFGSPMWTFYGMQWDVKSKPHAENVAYTSQFLGLHQDLMYHDPIPRLQFLACVSNSCNGGESLFSDGVRAAYQLKLTRPDLYKVLTKPTARFHYYRHGGQSHYYERAHSTITEGEAGRVESTQWAPPFQAPFPRKADLAEWKEAAAAFEAILSAPENMFTYKLNPGDVVVFDNTRILHGRNEFRTTEGKRHLQGMYLSDQDFKLQLRLLNNSRRWEVLPDVPEFRRKVVEGELWQV